MSDTVLVRGMHRAVKQDRQLLPPTTLDAPTARCERDHCGALVPVETMHLDHDDDCPTNALGFCGCRTVCEACCRTCNGEGA